MAKSPADATLDLLCPMHLRVGPTGHVLHAGPTAEKLCPARSLVGMRFLELFCVKRPRAVARMSDLLAGGPQKLRLEMRNRQRTALRGILLPRAGAEGAALVNLGFGISLIEAVGDYGLTNVDFATTDLAIEMLYLVEAKAAAMEASHRLNLRLQGARLAAEERAFTDTLTGLGNRRALEAVLARLAREGRAFAVMQIDLDFFKRVNDSLGHAAGDHVLREVARIMGEETRGEDSIARVGGDEFTLVLPEVPSEAQLRAIGARLIERIERPIPFGDQLCRISASIGTTWIEAGQAPPPEELLSNADLALYASKRAGRAQHTFYSPALRRTAQG